METGRDLGGPVPFEVPGTANGGGAGSATCGVSSAPVPSLSGVRVVVRCCPGSAPRRSQARGAAPRGVVGVGWRADTDEPEAQHRCGDDQTDLAHVFILTSVPPCGHPSPDTILRARGTTRETNGGSKTCNATSCN